MAIPVPINTPIGLKNSFGKTNLDLENPLVLGGPNNDYNTEYPESSTGTPTISSNPGQPQKFIHKYTPKNTYLSKIIGSSNNEVPLTSVSIPDPAYPLKLVFSLNKTNLDVENPGVLGGPNKDISTIYPSTTTGVPTVSDYPSGPTTKFSQPYNPGKTYLSTINNKSIIFSPLSGDAEFPDVLNISHLDNSQEITQKYSSVINDPTVYNENTQKTSPTFTGWSTIYGQPAQKLEINYGPSRNYLEYINPFLTSNPKETNPNNKFIDLNSILSNLKSNASSLLSDLKSNANTAASNLKSNANAAASNLKSNANAAGENLKSKTNEAFKNLLGGFGGGGG